MREEHPFWRGLRRRSRDSDCRPYRRHCARGRQVGNFPQAFNHLALINAAPGPQRRADRHTIRVARPAAAPAGTATTQATPREADATVTTCPARAGELGRASLGSLLREADWRWVIAALGLSAATYAAATEALMGFVPGRLSFRLALLAQLASSFVTLVTPQLSAGPR